MPSRIITVGGNAHRALDNNDGTTTPLSLGVSGGGVIEVVPVLDTNAYAAGDVLFNPIALSDVGREVGGWALLQSLNVLDENDQGVEMDLVFMASQQNLGTINSAPNITAVNARVIRGWMKVAATDFIDLGAARIASLGNLGRMIQCDAGQTSLWVAGITRGAPTHTASGLRLRFGFIQG